MSSMLRASAKRYDIGTPDEWWEMRLLDLAIIADGRCETEVLQEVEHQLICRYAMDRKLNRVPFADIVHPDTPMEVRAKWGHSHKKFCHLQLPDEVRAALANAFACTSPDTDTLEMMVDAA